MDVQPDRLRLLEALAEELIKDRPAEDLVASYVERAGLGPVNGPIDRINQVLRAIGALGDETDFRE